MNFIWKSLWLAGACAASLPASGATPAAIAKTAGCMACHAQESKLLGPSFKDIAAKYGKDAAAPARLADHVRQGSKGIWGPVPMPPTDAAKISDADLKTVIAWILKS